MHNTHGIADVVEYWNRRPCKIRHSVKEVGSREYFDEIEKRKYFVEPYIPALPPLLGNLTTPANVVIATPSGFSSIGTGTLEDGRFLDFP